MEDAGDADTVLVATAATLAALILFPFSWRRRLPSVDVLLALATSAVSDLIRGALATILLLVPVIAGAGELSGTNLSFRRGLPLPLRSIAGVAP